MVSVIFISHPQKGKPAARDVKKLKCTQPVDIQTQEAPAPFAMPFLPLTINQAGVMLPKVMRSGYCLWVRLSIIVIRCTILHLMSRENLDIQNSASPSFPHPHPGKPIFIYQKPMRIVQMTLMVQALIVSWFFFFFFGMQAPDLSFDCQGIHFKEAPTSQMAAQPGKAPGYLPGLWLPQFRHIG